MNTLKLTVTIDIDGAAAADVAEDLLSDAAGGLFDQAVLNLTRAHLRRMGDFRDWKLSAVRVDVLEVTS